MVEKVDRHKTDHEKGGEGDSTIKTFITSAPDPILYR
jgi:hypothetical protein